MSQPRKPHPDSKFNPKITPAPLIKNRGEVTLHFHRWSEVDERWLQYCEVCGKARSIEPPPCEHSWKTMHESKISMGERAIGWLYTLRCELCGDIKAKKVEV